LRKPVRILILFYTCLWVLFEAFFSGIGGIIKDGKNFLRVSLSHTKSLYLRLTNHPTPWVCTSNYKKLVAPIPKMPPTYLRCGLFWSYFTFWPSIWHALSIMLKFCLWFWCICVLFNTNLQLMMVNIVSKWHQNYIYNWIFLTIFKQNCWAVYTAYILYYIALFFFYKHSHNFFELIKSASV